MKITLVGMGSGAPGSLTAAGLAALRGAERIIGARRLLEKLPDGCTENRALLYKAEEICALLQTTPAVQVEDEAGYFALVRAAFGQRRKTAANAIAGGLNLPKEKVIAAIEAAGFDARIRPEALTLEDFAKIQQALG